MTTRLKPLSILRHFYSSAAGGIALMGAAVLALITANSSFAGTYFASLHTSVGGLVAATLD